MELISLFILIAYSLYFYIRYHSLGDKQIKSLGKCVPMILGMTSSIVIGLLIGVWLPEMLALSTILSILFSAIIAYLIGSRFGLNGVLEAQGSSLMGAMMGAMLGVMLSANEISLMIIAVDFIYLVSMFFVMIMLTKDSVEKKQLSFKSMPATFYLIFIICLSIIGGMGILQTGAFDSPEGIENQVNHSHTH
ncbi:hypothetical protein [Metabacillus endolithicus]|uniref:DUF4203 domain-containing protein n=1 Tax=Metabacillus endolithicus TaxID=1535204 RepID=A0ABW5BZ80_9BACI|nr:hypothetical protein [Metabacillus endolithicus]UPG62470.1 hypothetical protein MVE64_18525 [Metabacillus endolithicus]